MHRSAGIRNIARKLARQYLSGTISFNELVDVSQFTATEACYFIISIASYLPDSAEAELRRHFAIQIDKLAQPNNESLQTLNA